MTRTGRVVMGFSKPYIAKYGVAEGKTSYTNGQRLARGVGIDIQPEEPEDSEFYADNIVAESNSDMFTKADVTVTVDGLLKEAEKFAFGLPEAVEETFGSTKATITKYGDAAVRPELGLAYITMWKSHGKVYYQPTILTKVKFKTLADARKTHEGEIDYQTQEIGGTAYRDDSTTHDWKWEGEEFATEAEAEAVIKAIFGVTA